MTAISFINYPTCINRCYIPENVTEGYETYKGKLLGDTHYYELNPCMLRLKFAQLAVTDWVIQPIMTIVMMVAEVYMAIRFLFNCLPQKHQTDNLEEKAKIAGGLFLHALSLPFVMFIPALLAAYSVIDVKNGRHAYCAVERYMYDAMGMSKQKLDEMDICTSRKPFLSHVAKPFAPVEIVDKYEKHCNPGERGSKPAPNENKPQAAPQKQKTNQSKTNETSTPQPHELTEAWLQDPRGRTQFTAGLHSACTPLAVYFALTAGKTHLEKRLGSPQEIGDILDLFFKESLTKAGFKNGTNYTVPMSIPIVHALTPTCIQVAETWTFDANAQYANVSRGNAESIEEKTWEGLISALQPGQGAVIIVGAYSLAVRRLEKYWEVFDVHNGKDLGATQDGAYIKRCSSKGSICAFLKHIIDHIRGDGFEDTGEGLLGNAIEISILQLNRENSSS